MQQSHSEFCHILQEPHLLAKISKLRMPLHLLDSSQRDHICVEKKESNPCLDKGPSRHNLLRYRVGGHNDKPVYDVTIVSVEITDDGIKDDTPWYQFW